MGGRAVLAGFFPLRLYIHDVDLGFDGLRETRTLAGRWFRTSNIHRRDLPAAPSRLCSPVSAAGGIAAGQLFLRRPSRGHALRIATLNTRREPLEAFVFWAILTAADQDVRAALLIPVVTGAGGYVAGEL